MLLSLLLLVFGVNAQEKVQRLSLDEAMQRALKNRYDVKIQQVNVNISVNEISKVTARNLPQLTSDLDLRYNNQLQTNVIPGSFFGPSTTEDKKVQFGTTYNTLWAFNFTQNIFNPTNHGDKQIAMAQAKYDQLNEKKTETEVKLDVVQAYFSALLWIEKLKLSNQNLQRTNAIYQTSKEQLAQGTITTYDASHYRIDYENALAENTKNSNNLNYAMSDLYYKMGEDTIRPITLSDDITSLYTKFQVTDTTLPTIKRPELDMQQAQLQIDQLNMHKQNLGYIPTISFYANYTLQYIDNTFTPFNGNFWYPFNYLGIKASIPLWDGGLKEKTKNEYKLRSESARLNYEKLQKDYHQDLRNALTNMRNATQDLDYQQKNLSLANELYQIDTDHLKNGTIKPNDLATTYYTLQQTQINYLTSVYNYLVAVANYKKSAGQL